MNMAIEFIFSFFVFPLFMMAEEAYCTSMVNTYMYSIYAITSYFYVHTSHMFIPLL